MNLQETQQVDGRDEKWVPSAKRVRISSTNIILETTVPQKEKTFQVIIDQFWYTIKKVQDADSYEFLLANKKCTVNAEVFKTILDICPRVECVDFTDVPDDETALTFLIDLGYKGLLNRHTNMFVDHMHQLWRTLAAIINKCLSRKTANLAYQIDHMKENRSKRENMPYPRFTKIIINHFQKQHKSLTNLNNKHYHAIKDDGIVSRLKFVRICKDYQKYRLPIPGVMLTDVIKHSESYQMFIKYSTYQIPPKKSKGKGSKGRKTVDDSQETVDVFEESEPELEPTKKKTSGKRRVKKKVTLSADDNIISDDPDVALELAMSITQTEAEETEAARKVHATHARIVPESVPEYAKKNTSKAKLKGASSLTLQEQEATDIIQALKESKKTSRRQPGTKGSKKGTGSKPGVLDESTVVFATSRDEQDSEFFNDDNDNVEKDDKDGDANDEGDDHVSNTQDADDEDVKTEFNEDEIYKCKICVCNEEDVEMKDTKVEEFDKGFGDQFLKLSSDSSLVSTVKDSADANYQVLIVIDSYLDTKVEDVFQKELQKHTADLICKYPLQHLPELTRKPTPTAEQEFEKSPSAILKIKKEQAKSQKNPQFTIKSTDKALLKIEELIAEVIMDDDGDDVAHDDNPPQDTSKSKTRKTLNPDWFKQPSRPSTPNPEWNKRQVVLDQPVQLWFNQMVYASKDPLTFNDLMATSIDFSKYVLYGLKIENLTQVILLGPDFNLLKDTCSSSIELEYNFQECFNALINKLDWNNQEGDRYPFDLSNPLPLQGPPEVPYTTSITKTKVARYEIKGIKDMVSKFSKQNVYSTKAVLGVKSVSVKKLHGYGHLEEIMVKRSDHSFICLKMSDIVDFIVALRMITKSLILKRRVEDLQLGVEKIVYEDLDKQKRVLQADELYKFLDGTLKSVCDEIHHIILDFRLDYNKEMPKRKWMVVD
nr:hypothetical protein [Tanacetum cinerariifolium]